MEQGDTVQVLIPEYGYWRFGTFVRTIVRGKQKGWHVVRVQRKTTAAYCNKKFRPEHVKPK